MTRKERLLIMLDELLDELLENVREVKGFIYYIFNKFNELEREEDMMDYLEALSYMEEVIKYYK